MINTVSVIKQAEQQCKANGVRLTPKRKQILTGLLYSHTGLSAYELVDYYKVTHGDPIPPMSVYRILDFLQEQRLVHKLNLANKYVACAHITCGHDHGTQQFLICGKCERVEEISVPQKTIKAIQLSVEKAGFELVSRQLEMNCLCQNCHDKAT
tara:strand:- start:1244 stop:1705 length:462 start_codon:yes stop_codon:yes gene_type:complete